MVKCLNTTEKTEKVQILKKLTSKGSPKQFAFPNHPKDKHCLNVTPESKYLYK